MIPVIRITGLREVRAKFARWPEKFNQAIKTTMDAGLHVLHANVGNRGYPPPPTDSTYTRTHLLSNSLGVGGGNPDIYEVRDMGGGNFTGSFGTKVDYAPYVIGSKQSEQAWMHKGRWWTLPEDIVQDSIDKIEKLFKAAVETLADWINRNG